MKDKPSMLSQVNPDYGVADCCNSRGPDSMPAQNWSLHEQLSFKATEQETDSRQCSLKAEGYRTLCEMLPVGLTVRQQDVIRKLLFEEN